LSHNKFSNTHSNNEDIKKSYNKISDFEINNLKKLFNVLFG